MQKVDVCDGTKEEIRRLHVMLLVGIEPVELAVSLPELEHMKVSVERLKQSLTKCSRTAGLCISIKLV